MEEKTRKRNLFSEKGFPKCNFNSWNEERMREKWKRKEGER